VHHDALKIPNRETVLLGRVHQGQHATVVQISATLRTVNKRKSEPSSAEPPPILMGDGLSREKVRNVTAMRERWRVRLSPLGPARRYGRRQGGRLS
jgi:hypothetical protein